MSGEKQIWIFTGYFLALLAACLLLWLIRRLSLWKLRPLTWIQRLLALLIISFVIALPAYLFFTPKWICVPSDLPRERYCTSTPSWVEIAYMTVVQQCKYVSPLNYYRGNAHFICPGTSLANNLAGWLQGISTALGAAPAIFVLALAALLLLAAVVLFVRWGIRRVRPGLQRLRGLTIPVLLLLGLLVPIFLLFSPEGYSSFFLVPPRWEEVHAYNLAQLFYYRLAEAFYYGNGVEVYQASRLYFIITGVLAGGFIVWVSGRRLWGNMMLRKAGSSRKG